jgi:hypothetical protein
MTPQWSHGDVAMDILDACRQEGWVIEPLQWSHGDVAMDMTVAGSA